MTRRRLECACGVQVQPLCPFHAAQRHLLRLRLRGSVGPDDPLLPAQTGGFMPKHAVIHKFRQVLQAAGVELTYTDPNGRLRQLFGGHAAHVAGASFLAAHGVPTPVIQLLERYTKLLCWLWRAAAGGGPRPLALQAAPVPADGPCAEAAPGAEGPREDGVPDVVYVAPPPNARLAAQEVEPTLVMRPRTLRRRPTRRTSTCRAEWVTPCGR